MGGQARALGRLHRVGEQVVVGDVAVGDLVDEAGVGPVFQQTADQIGQQVAIAADRRIDAHGDATLGHQALVEAVAHAMQALELEVAARAGPFHHRGDGQGIVGGEGRKEAAALGQHGAGASHVTDVGRGLAGEHRIVDEAPLLRALDLAVPVGALHQADHDGAAGGAAERPGPGDHRRRAALIGLDRHAQAIPAGQGRIARGALDDVERHFQAVGLLGVDGQADAGDLGGAGHLDQLAGQVGHGAASLQRLVARVQGRELYRNAVTGKDVAVPRLPADRLDGLEIGFEIALGVEGGVGPLPQHVEGIAEGAVGPAIGALERLADVAAEHEGLAHALHGLGDRDADGRLAHARDQ